MAFSGIGLFLAGAIALITQGPSIWPAISSQTPPPAELKALLLAMSGIIGFLFVLWQLSRQHFADEMTTACDKLIHEWLTTAPKDPQPAFEVETNKRLGKEFPSALKKKVDEVLKDWAWDWRNPKKWLKPRQSACLFCLTMLTFAGMAIWRMLI